MFVKNDSIQKRRLHAALFSYLREQKFPWFTQKGTIVQDDARTHTIKFSSWQKAIDPENEDFTPLYNGQEFMTVKWGRGEKTTYTGYKGGDIKGIVRVPEEARTNLVHAKERGVKVEQDKSDQFYELKKLDVKVFNSGMEHAKHMAGYVGKNNDEFKYNVRYCLRVKLTSDEVRELDEELTRLEKKANFGPYEEMGTRRHPAIRTSAPIEVLAKILDKEFKFTDAAVLPSDFMQEFANHFPQKSSLLECEAYTGKRLVAGAVRKRISDAEFLAKAIFDRPFVSVDVGYRGR